MTSAYEIYYVKIANGIEEEIVEDTVWKLDFREMEKEITAFGRTFINWSWTLKGKSNSNCFTQWVFLQHNLAIFGNNCHPSIRDVILMEFNESELR